MKTIKCMLDKKNFEVKPQGKEIGAITNRISKLCQEIELSELAKCMSNGCTFRPSVLNGSKEQDWIQQQLFGLDFDENTTIEEELNRCKKYGILPIFGYTTFSHEENHHKFRLVFCVNEIINDYNIAKQFQLTLMDIFKNCDEKCKNLSRLYFGGRKLIYEGFDNVIDYKVIIDNYGISIVEGKVNRTEKPHNNNDISSNISNLMGLVSQPNENYYNIKALRDRNVEYLKDKINNPKIILENNQAFFDYIKTYDLGRLLEIKYSTSFRCIFHEDNSPSAGIFVNDEGTYIYHCFSCGKSYNIINLVEKLGCFKSRPKAYKFIRDIFNLEIMDNEWVKEQKEILDENLRVIRSGELEKQCPTTYKNIKRNSRYLEELIMIAKDNVYSEKFTDNEDNVVFYASARYICKQLGMSEESAKEVSKKNVLFAYHDLINKVSDGEAPEEMLKRSQAISANSLDKNKKYRHVNYYSIPSYTTELLESIEEQGIKWNENNYTMKGLTREMIFRNEGYEVANKLYPQYTHVYDKENSKVVERTTTNISNLRTELIVKILIDMIDSNGYAYEKEIIDELSASGEIKTSKSEAEKQVKKSLPEILTTYNLLKIKLNKSLKEEYGITVNGYPFIITKNQQ